MSNSYESLAAADNYFMKQAMEKSADEMIKKLDNINNIADLFEREKLIVKMEDDVDKWLGRYYSLFDKKEQLPIISKTLGLKYIEIEKNFLKQLDMLSLEDKAILDAKWEEEGELKQSESSPAPAAALTMAPNVLLNPFIPRPNYTSSSTTTPPNVLLNPYTPPPAPAKGGYRRRNKRSKKQSKKSKKSRRSKKSKKSRKSKTSRRR